MEHLHAALDVDERIVLLREQVERQARAQLEERAITAADYVTVRTDLDDARVARLRHQIELAQAQAGYLTTLGIRLP
jgi:outer membrane protein TolC